MFKERNNTWLNFKGVFFLQYVKFVRIGTKKASV